MRVLSSISQKIKPTNFNSTLQEWKTKTVYIIDLNSEKISQALKWTVGDKFDCKRKKAGQGCKFYAQASIKLGCVWY